MRKYLKKIHLWLSIPAGLIITLICFTGAVLVFETEILEAYYPERYFIKEINSEPIPIAKLIPLVNKQLDTCSVSAVKVFNNPGRTYAMTLDKGFRVTAFVNPYTGNITGIHSFRESFFFTIMSLHRWLMDGSHTWGKYTVGISTIFFIFILLTGAIIWIPKSKKRLKNRLTINFVNGKKRFFYDLHIVAGIYVCIFLLICSLTGLMWSFEWYRQSVFKLFGAEISPKQEQRKGGGKGKKETDFTHWQKAIDQLDKNYQYATIQDKSITVSPQDAPHIRATDKYTFDNKTGQITSVTRYNEQEMSSQVMGWAYALHVGGYGGVWSKIITCIASLIGASLPLTGYYMYYRKFRKKKKGIK